MGSLCGPLETGDQEAKGQAACWLFGGLGVGGQLSLSRAGPEPGV